MAERKRNETRRGGTGGMWHTTPESKFKLSACCDSGGTHTHTCREIFMLLCMCQAQLLNCSLVPSSQSATPPPTHTFFSPAFALHTFGRSSSFAYEQQKWKPSFHSSHSPLTPWPVYGVTAAPCPLSTLIKNLSRLHARMHVVHYNDIFLLLVLIFFFVAVVVVLKYIPNKGYLLAVHANWVDMLE